MSTNEYDASTVGYNISSKQIDNTSSSLPLNFPSKSFPIVITYFVISACGILFNAFTIVVIVLYKPLRKQITNILIANQCAMDAMAATLLIFTTALPNKFVALKPGSLSDEAYCRLWISELPMWSMLTSSTYGIVSITFERFLAVVYPMWHKAYFTRQKAAALNLGVWLIGLCYYVPFGVIASGISNNGQCFTFTRYIGQKSGYVNTVFLFMLAYIFPLSLMSYFYLRMNLALRRKLPPAAVSEFRRNVGVRKDANDENTTVCCKDANGSIQNIETIKEQSVIYNISVEEDRMDIANKTVGATGENAKHGERSGLSTRQTVQSVLPKESLSTTRARRNIMKTMILVSVGFVLCWTCSEIYFFTTNLGFVKSDFAGVFYKFTVVMVFISTCVNPVIYCAQYKMFQKGCKWMFCRNNSVMPISGTKTKDLENVVTLTSSVEK